MLAEGVEVEGRELVWGRRLFVPTGAQGKGTMRVAKALQ